MIIVGDDKNSFGTLIISCSQEEYDRIPIKWFFTKQYLLGNEKEIDKLISMGVEKEELDGYDYFKIVVEAKG